VAAEGTRESDRNIATIEQTSLAMCRSSSEHAKCHSQEPSFCRRFALPRESRVDEWTTVRSTISEQLRRCHTEDGGTLSMVTCVIGGARATTSLRVDMSPHETISMERFGTCARFPIRRCSCVLPQAPVEVDRIVGVSAVMHGFLATLRR